MKALNPATAGELVTRLSRIGPDTPGRWGRMSSHQMLCHLNDSFGLAMGRKRATEKITWAGRTVMRWGGLYLPIPWPKNLPTMPEMDPSVAGSRPSTFEADHTALAAAIREFASEPRAFRFGRHPLFGELTPWEWMRWGFLHADHHFRQFGA